MAAGSALRPFAGHLDRYLAAATPEERHAIEGELHHLHGATRTIVVTDMARFSKTVARYGIVHYLALIRQCHKLVLPALRQHGGHVLRTEADNSYSLFEVAGDAAAAARAAQAAVRRHNAACRASDRLGISIGIGHGDLLLRGPADAYGHEFNLASKLGEDIGGGGQVLLTAAARKAARLRPAEVAVRRAGVSGMDFEYFELLL